jgi:hypothetical protein
VILATLPAILATPTIEMEKQVSEQPHKLAKRGNLLKERRSIQLYAARHFCKFRIISRLTNSYQLDSTSSGTYTERSSSTSPTSPSRLENKNATNHTPSKKGQKENTTLQSQEILHI